ncbi:beta-alanine-activating enzyme isoform X2 [Mixophyes fleayi]
MECSLHGMVVHAAAVHGDRKAVCFQTYDGTPVFCTYQEMMWRAEELTVFLKSHVYHLENKLIGLYCHPGIHLPSWIMGILQVPAAYSPIDPTAPSHFISLLIERSKMRYMLVENNKVEMFKLLLTGWIERDSSTLQHLDVTLFEDVRSEKAIDSSMINCLDKDTNSNAKNDVDRIAGGQDFTERLLSTEYIDIQDRQCLAYVLHTSGTTGVPKIVSVPHCCIVPNIHHLRSIFDVSPDDLVFLASPMTFDPSVIEMFLTLSAGACLLIVPDPLKMMPDKLCKLLFHQHRVTVLQVTPTFLRRFGSHSIQSSVLSRETSLKVLALGGEQFPPVSILRSWREPGNKTRVFNLYGITEVSSWATYYEVPETILNSHTGSDIVTLGSPLHGTTVEVRNDDGIKIEEGEGQVFIGGRQRVCFLDDDLILPYGTMRQTGDWVRLQDGDMFYLGRKDNQIKRHGKRLNTEYIQQVVDGLEPVETCAVMWFEAKKLVLFVVPKRPLEKRSLWRELQTHLQSYAVPDDLLLVDSLLLTKHGKIDFSRLSLIYSNHLRKKMHTHLTQTEDDLWYSLQDLWKSILALPEDCPAVAGDSVFLLSGGDSLKAIRLHEEVEILVGKPVPGLLEIILSDTLLDVHRHIIKYTYPMEEQIQDKINVKTMEKNPYSSVVDVNAKCPCKRKSDILGSSETDGSSFISLSRGSRLFINLCSQAEVIGQQCQVMHGSSPDLACLLDCSSTGQKRAKSTKSHDQAVSLRERWASDTGKCVDASPLLVMPTIKDSSVTVYIGSHSHRVQALDLHTGTVVWERILADRIESSAAVSKCGNFILVGCYDGSVYALRRSNGETHWIFTTGNAVKSSPAVDPVSGLAIFGSHDQYLYAVDIEGKRCVWKSDCEGGAVFSSPCISTKPHHRVYIATLGGGVLALNPATGKTVWKVDVDKPVFSSPQCSQIHVYVGCVDANFYCLSHLGEKLWHFATDGPIFSSPCMSTLSKQVIFSSHDGLIYSLNTEGDLLWKFKTSSRVYATPFVFPHPHTGNTELLAAASTDGNLWVLDSHSGLLIAQHTLEGEIFSSPVVYGDRLVVGCRNNFVYCFDLISCLKQHADLEGSSGDY